MKVIAAYIGSAAEANFFFRLADAFRHLGYEFIFLSNKISIVFSCLLNGFRSKIVRCYSPEKKIPGLEKCFEVSAGYLNNEQAGILFSSVYKEFSILAEEISPEYIFIWNGCSVQTMAASCFSNDMKIKKRYFELANFPGKIFVNPDGVNAGSSLYYNINILDSYPADDALFIKWKNKYLRETNHLPRQARNLRRINNYLFPVDIAGFKYLNFPQNGEISLLKKLHHFLLPPVKLNYDDYDYRSGKYLFLPLQVSYDSQVTINSDLGNIEALEIAMERAHEYKADILVKPHPAEGSRVFLNKLNLMHSSMGFALVNYPVTDLVLNAESVITINSTVGLISRILDKRTEFLGRSFFPYMNNEQLKNYVMSYLVDADYFSKDEIKPDAAEKILSIR